MNYANQDFQVLFFLILDSVLSNDNELAILRLPKAGDIVFEVLQDPKLPPKDYCKRKFIFAKFSDEDDEVLFGSGDESNWKFDCKTVSNKHFKLKKRNSKIFIQPFNSQYGTAKYLKSIPIFPHQEYELQLNKFLLTITLRRETPKKINPLQSPASLKRKITMEEIENELIKKRKISSTGILGDEFSGPHHNF